MSAKVGVLGAGAWGTAVAKVIEEKGIDVDIWSHEKETAEDINLRHLNSRYLPDVVLPENLRAYTDPAETADGKEFLILASPSLYLLDSVKKILWFLPSGKAKPPSELLPRVSFPPQRAPGLSLKPWRITSPVFTVSL